MKTSLLAAAGENDRAVEGGHDCAGESQTASDPKSWLYVPIGTCVKFQGGSLEPKM